MGNSSVGDATKRYSVYIEDPSIVRDPDVSVLMWAYNNAQQIEQAKTKTKAVKSDYEQLKEDYEKLLEKCNSLLLENFELRQRL